MRKSLVLVALLLGCGGGSAPAPEPSPDPGQRPAGPGESLSLAAPISAALDCPAPGLTWTADGGTVTSAGVFTAPACGAAAFPATFIVTAAGCGKTATIEIPVQEAVISIRVCGPSAMEPGATAQFAAQVTYSCPGHVEISPPGAVCP